MRRLQRRRLEPKALSALVMIAVGGVAAAVAGFDARAVTAADDKPHTTWTEYLGGPDSTQYSALKQINKSNVKQLEVAWTFAAGEGTVRFNPIVVDNVMYVLGANRSIVAIDATTGKEVWTHRNEGAVGDRGINYWESKDRSERRLLYMNGGFLTAIDAKSGSTIAGLRGQRQGGRQGRSSSRRQQRAAAADRESRDGSSRT